jgi:hypothetical protein
MKVHDATLARAMMLAWLIALTAPQARAQAGSAQSAAPVHGAAIDSSSPAPAAPAASASPATPAAKPEAMRTVKVGGEEYQVADFQYLASFPLETPTIKVSSEADIAKFESQIPASIKGLEGKKVMVRGFMVPVKDIQGRTTEFLIVRDQPTCCFSGMTTITEFVTIKVPSPGVETILDQPLTVQGKLHVGAQMDSGYILGVYKMEGEKLVDPPKS